MPEKVFDHDAKVKWDSDPDLRKEFSGDYECFRAYYEAKQRGLIKLQGGRIR